MSLMRACLAMLTLMAGFMAWARPCAGAGAGMVWQKQAVRYPVAVADIQPRPPHTPTTIADTRGPIEVGPDRAAAVWIESAGLLRVRTVHRRSESVQFGRIFGTGAAGAERPGAAPNARVVMPEPGIKTMTDHGHAAWYLMQPPGGGDIWYITAKTSTQVVVERPARRTGRLIWEQTRDEVLAWIERGGPLPDIPVAPGSDDLEQKLRTDAAIAGALIRAYSGSPALARAVAQWRKASALTAMSVVRPVLRPYFVSTRLDTSWSRTGGEVMLQDESGKVVSATSYRAMLDDTASWQFTLTGPGVLRIQARALLDSAQIKRASPRQDARPREIGIELTTADALLGRDHGPLTAATTHERPLWKHAVPARSSLYGRKSRVSFMREIRVPLLHGTHTYRLTLTGGPALIRAAHIRRRSRLMETIDSRAEPGDFIRRAEAHLERVTEPAAIALVRALLDELRAPVPSIREQIAGLPPLLQLVGIRAQTRRLHMGLTDGEALSHRVQALLGRLDPHPSPEARLIQWQIRAQFARAFGRWIGSDHAASFLAPRLGPQETPADHAMAPARPPPDLGAKLAEILADQSAELLAEEPGLHRNLALRMAEDAWRMRPVHPDRRRDYLAFWYGKTRWSLLSPSTTDIRAFKAKSMPAWRWLDPRARASHCRTSEHLKPIATRGSTQLLYLPLGSRCWIDVRPLAPGSTRLARLQFHVFTTEHSPGPITLRIGDNEWNTLAFERLETLEFAILPGTYPVYIDAPAGTVSLIELPSVFDELERAGTPMRRRWPIHTARGTPVRYDIPPYAGGSPMRIELREIVSDKAVTRSTPVTIRVRGDTGWQRTLSFTSGALDPTLIPLDAPGGLTMPVRFALWLPEGTGQVWFESSSDRALVAAVSIRRPGRRSTRAHAPANPSAQATAGPATPGVATASDQPAVGAPASTLAPPCRDDHAAQPKNQLIAQLYQLSRCLLQTPDNPRLRLQRGDLLLDLGEASHARVDLDAIAALDPAPDAPWFPAYESLRSRISNWRRMSHLRPQPHPERFAAPTPLSPALLALGATVQRLQAWTDMVAQFRLQSAAGGHPDLDIAHAGSDHAGKHARDPVAAYMLARLHRLAGRHRDAALIAIDTYLATGIWQMGLDALVDFNQTMSTEVTISGGAVASLAYELASRLSEIIEHVEVRHALAMASKRSRRQPVRGVEAHAGFERLYLDETQFEPDLEALIPWAWLAPPWSQDQSRRLRPGQGARISFDLARPAAVWAEVWCRTRDGQAYPCQIEWWVDQRGPTTATANPEKTEALITPPVPLKPGAHVIEVVLRDSDAGTQGVASVRFMTDRPLGAALTPASRARKPAKASSPPGAAMTFRRPSRVYLAREEHPITLSVAGPMALWIEARTRLDAPASTLTLTSTPLDPGTSTQSTQTSFVLNPEPDSAVSGDPQRGIQVSRPIRNVLLLTRPGPHRITLSTTGGIVLARLASRRDIAAEPALEPVIASRQPTPDEQAPDESPPSRSAANEPAERLRARPPLADTYAQPAPGLPWRSFTHSLEAGVGVDDFGGADVSDSGAPRADAAVLVRRRVMPGRLWIGGDLWLRTRLASTLASGLRAAAHVRRLPGDLRMDGHGDLAWQRVAGASAFAARASLTVDRTFSLTPALLAIPALGAEVRHYNLDAPPGEEIDPRVFNQYGRDHHRAIEPRLSLYWQPFQDQAGVLSLWATSNADLTTPDYLTLSAAWRGVLEIAPLSGPVVEIDYRISQRFADAHRSQGYIRHDPGLNLQWALWRGRSGRLLLEARFRAYMAAGMPDHHHFRVGLRYDWTAGRGLVDFFPREVDFDDFEEPRLWSPPR